MGWIVKEQDPRMEKGSTISDPDFVMHGISIRTLVHAGIVVLLQEVEVFQSLLMKTKF